jgi:hypothetical protein
MSYKLLGCPFSKGVIAWLILAYGSFSTTGGISLFCSNKEVRVAIFKVFTEQLNTITRSQTRQKRQAS